MSSSPIPNTWAESSLSEICQINPRNKDINDDTDVTFVPMAAVDEHTGKIVAPQIKKWEQVKKGFTHFQENDVILAKITPCMENKKFAVAENLLHKIGAGSTEFHVIRPPVGISPQFLWNFFRQEKFVAEAEKNMTGSAGQKRIPTTYIKTVRVPIPPTAEQKRIVGKIESTQEKIKTIEESVSKAEELIGKYRESLLQKAFRGQLVPQDPNDEPASELLKRIRTERAQATDNKKKKKEDLPPISEDEIPF